jgi:hypothetical protein
MKNVFIVIPNLRIATVRTVGDSYPVTGGILGAVVCCTVGCSSSKDKSDPAVGLGGFALGGLLGCLVGGCETVDYYITPDGPRDFKVLKPLARYQTEPEVLKKIVEH